MKIAVISDIHSNIHALEAVLKNIKDKSVDLIVCTGDLVGYHPYPNEVIKIIEENNILTTLGNHDLNAIRGNVVSIDNLTGKNLEKAIISNYTIENLTSESKRFLKSLPISLTMNIDGKVIKFVHGSPRSITEYLTENSKEAEEVMSDLDEDILICGHTHIAYYKKYKEKILINAGSVGKPKKGIPDSEYILLEIKNDIVDIKICNVKYDVDSIIKAIEKSSLPNDLGLLLKHGGRILDC